LAYTIKARDSGEATAYYEYDAVVPCTAQTGECADCSAYAGCKSPYVPKCDGSESVSCEIPTNSPTSAPTESELEQLYRECQNELIETEFQKEDFENTLQMCSDKGITGTDAPTDLPTKAPTPSTSISPTTGPTKSPTDSPSPSPSTSRPTNNPTFKPTDEPTWSPTCDCFDLVPAGEDKWYDVFGENYD
jgi:hypothetical protein